MATFTNVLRANTNTDSPVADISTVTSADSILYSKVIRVSEQIQQDVTSAKTIVLNGIVFATSLQVENAKIYVYIELANVSTDNAGDTGDAVIALVTNNSSNPQANGVAFKYQFKNVGDSVIMPCHILTTVADADEMLTLDLGIAQTPAAGVYYDMRVVVYYTILAD